MQKEALSPFPYHKCKGVKVNKSVININIFLQSGMLLLQVTFYVIGEITSMFFPCHVTGSRQTGAKLNSQK